MLAHDFTKTPLKVVTHIKLDGIRCVIDKNGMHTRGGKPTINSCPYLGKCKTYY